MERLREYKTMTKRKRHLRGEKRLKKWQEERKKDFKKKKKKRSEIDVWPNGERWLGTNRVGEGV